MTWEEMEEQHDEMVNDCYPVTKIGYLEFSAADILKSCDPIAYQISVSEYHDYLAEEVDA